MHLLDKLCADHFGDGSATRTSDKYACISRGDSSLSFHTAQEFEDFFWLTRLMTLIVLPDSLICRRVDHNRFHGCRTYVQANQELIHPVLLVAHRADVEILPFG